ncbi:MAG TPA: glycosyltransferase family 1 protein [candidate division Zixibacteria bacterium]|nr:glycosyltransferase family 1 protein [candidate division Zixibacteria bacterium]
MKVGIDCRLPYYQMGGISQYILHLLPSLAQLDQEGEYLVYHSRKDTKSHLPAGAKNFIRRNLYTPSHHRFERWAQSAELLFQDLDLYHSPDFIPPAFGARRRIITVHDLNFVHYPEFLTAESRRYYLDQIEWAVREADHVVADSDYTRQDLINLLGVREERITTVYLAANPIYCGERSDEEIAEVLKKFELVEGFILFVGTISPRKNVRLLIDTYEKLHGEMGFNKPLVLVGAAGWLSQDVQGEIDGQKASADIRHLLDVTDYELSCLYSAAGVLTLPSYYEGFGLPALEAMHCGCPVISSDRGSLPEIVGDAGKLLDPDDLDSWIEAIDLMTRDESLRNQARQKGLEQAAKFTWHRTASETLEIYRRSVT